MRASTVKESIEKLPINTRFSLKNGVTELHSEFLAKHGFLIFGNVFSTEEVSAINAEIDRVREDWISTNRKVVNGIPIFAGRTEDGIPLLQRMPFTSCFSDLVRQTIRDQRLEPIKNLIGQNVRIGDEEKDGCVVNTYLNIKGSIYPRLGWHTDGLRDIFYLRKPKQMLNVGLHLSDCPADNGGLRLIPGSHEQSMFAMAFRKPYFIDHRADKKEIVVETQAGDLTVHDGRLWHRVAQSQRIGHASFRRSMYVPYLTDAFEPKGESSKMPIYHRLGQAARWWKNRD